MTITDTRPDDMPVADASASSGGPVAAAPPQPVAADWLTTGDHKKIGRLYIGAALDLRRRGDGHRGAPRHRARRLERHADPEAQRRRSALLALRDRHGVPLHGAAVPRHRGVRRPAAGGGAHSRLPARGRRVVLGLARRVRGVDRQLHHERRPRRRRCEGRRPVPALIQCTRHLADAGRGLRRRDRARPPSAGHDDRSDAARGMGLHGWCAAAPAHPAGPAREPGAHVGRPPVRAHRVRRQLRHQSPHRLDGRRSRRSTSMPCPRSRCSRRSHRSSPGVVPFRRRARSWPAP